MNITTQRIKNLLALSAIGAALAACGGGGGHDDPPLEVSVSVDGVTDPNTLTPGESATISVPSGATLVFSSEGQTGWTPVATESTFQVNSFSFTSKSLTVDSNGGGSLVVVFKNNADETQKATLTVNVAPQEFQAVARVDGEVEAWSETAVESDGSSSQSNFFRRTVLMDAGGYGLDIASTPGAYSQSRSLYDAQDRYLGFVNTATGSECRYDNPVAFVSYPLHVGQTWSGDAKRVCGFQTFAQQYSRSVEAYERVVVPQGSHDALRIKAEAHYSVTYSDPNVPGYGYTTNSTCWWAVDLGRNVKCDYVFHYDDSTTGSRTEVMTSLTR